MVPTLWRRFCTKYFKVIPATVYVTKPCTMFIGLCKGEENRVLKIQAKTQKRKKKITNEYPLIEAGIARQGCIDIIKDAGLKVPPRSFCYFCPFITRVEARKLALDHPDLFAQVLKLEKDCCLPGYTLTPGKMPFDKFARTEISNICSYSQE